MTRTALVALLAAGLAGCADTTPTALSPTEATLSRAGRAGHGGEDSDSDGNRVKVRRIRGRCETTFNPPPFPPPAIHTQTDVGSCMFKPFGQMDFIGVQQINFAAGTQSGERTLTARNGDVLRASHSGTSAPAGPGLVRFSATAIVTGGTGRFAGVRGELHVVGTASVAERRSESSWEGWLEFPTRRGRD